MFETIKKTAVYLGNFNMDKITFGEVDIYVRDETHPRIVTGGDYPLYAITCTYNPRPVDKLEQSTDFRFWDDERWYQHIKAFYEKNRLNAWNAKIVTVRFNFLMDDGLTVMYELEWTNIYGPIGFNRLIVAPFRDGPVSDVYLLPEETAKLHDIDSTLDMIKKAWSNRLRVRYADEGVSSLPLILRGTKYINLIKYFNDRFY